jgi:hypothetical protein
MERGMSDSLAGARRASRSELLDLLSHEIETYDPETGSSHGTAEDILEALRKRGLVVLEMMQDTEAPVVDGYTFGEHYTLTGRDVWVFAAYFDRPAMTFVNVQTGEHRTGVVGSLLVREFKPIKEGVA